MSKKKTSTKQNTEMNFQENNNIIDKRSNDEKNIPVLVITYFVIAIFVAMLANIIIFTIRDADTVIANSYNKRENIYANKVIKGSILSSDGEVLAETIVDDEGNETRYYPYENMFSHVVGYDSNGQSGLEMMSTYYLLTSNQNIIRQVYNALADKKNIGNNVITTLDYDLQETAYYALGYNNGAVVVIEPSTGKMLVSVSKPDFNPNNIDSLIVSEDSESSYLLNRATQGLYPPGSTFKIITALEYMRENSNYLNYSYKCNGEDVFNGVGIHCYNYKVHGNINLKDSLAYSCNTSFSNIGISLDKAKYRNLCEDFLFNKDLPFDGYYSKSKFVINEKSDTSSMPQTAIGQGDTLITPLHNAMIMCTIANGGVLMKPYLIDRIESCEGNLVKKFKPDTYGKIITAKEAKEISNMLSGVTDYGTASDYFYGADYKVIGKTGTAEYNENGDSHSWFVGYSNPDNPDIVVCVLVENASSSGASASYIARLIFDKYYLDY